MPLYGTNKHQAHIIIRRRSRKKARFIYIHMYTYVYYYIYNICLMSAYLSWLLYIVRPHARHMLTYTICSFFFSFHFSVERDNICVWLVLLMCSRRVYLSWRQLLCVCVCVCRRTHFMNNFHMWWPRSSNVCVACAPIKCCISNCRRRPANARVCMCAIQQ